MNDTTKRTVTVDLSHLMRSRGYWSMALLYNYMAQNPDVNILLRTYDTELCLNDIGNIYEQMGLVQPGRTPGKTMSYSDYGYGQSFLMDEVDIGPTQSELTNQWKKPAHKRLRNKASTPSSLICAMVKKL